MLRPSTKRPTEAGSGDSSQPPGEPSSTPATARKPDDGPPAPEPTGQETWTARTCPVHQRGDLIEGRYEVRERFEGAMGYVYIARDTTQDLTFAIKQPKKEMLANRHFFARVLREADAWTGLGMHPHIAYCYFVKSLEGVPHIFVEYVDGGNLRDWISEGRCPDERARLELAIQFCQGMEHAHGRGMIHRDIKPENILVTAQGTVKVTDFGLVGEAAGRVVTAPAGSQASGTRLGDLMGTPAYMAPEQLADPRQRSAEVPEGVWTDSDVYSFGVCLWELFCGGRPDQFESTGTAAIQRARPDLPPRLGELLLATVAKNRTQRPPDFTALRERLNAIYRELFQEDAPSYRIEVPETAADELNNQGYSYFELGKPEEARACFERARKIEPTHPQATYNLSLLQWRTGEIDDLEVLRRLENCKQNPATDKQTPTELTASIHAERFAPDLAREVLKEYPGRFEALFGEAETGHIRCLRVLEGHSESVTSVALSRDGRRAISCSNDNIVKLWDMETGACLRSLEGHSGWVEAVALSTDGRRALSGSDDKTLKLWDLETGACLRDLEGHTGSVNAVALSTDGRRALSGSVDETLRLWDLETGACLRTLEGSDGDIRAVALSADGRQVLSGSDQTARIWDVESGRCLRALEGHPGGIRALALSADGRRALSGSGTKHHFQLLDMPSFVFGHRDTGSFSRSGIQHHFVRDTTPVPSIDSALQLWDLGTGSCLCTLKGHANHVEAVTISADGRKALSGSWDKTVKLWDLESGTCLRTLEGHAAEVYAVALTRDGRWALSGSADKTLRLWDLQTGTCVRTLEGHTDEIVAVAVGIDGRWGLSGGFDKTLRLWDLEGGECLHVLEGHAGTVTSVALSSDGQWAVSGSADTTVRVWRIIWELEFPDPADWDEEARSYLQTFLTLNCPRGEDGISRVGKPQWEDDDFQKLIEDLRFGGYGWLRPEGVRRELERMKEAWEGPPPLAGQTS